MGWVYVCVDPLVCTCVIGKKKKWTQFSRCVHVRTVHVDHAGSWVFTGHAHARRPNTHLPVRRSAKRARTTGCTYERRTTCERPRPTPRPGTRRVSTGRRPSCHAPLDATTIDGHRWPFAFCIFFTFSVKFIYLFAKVGDFAKWMVEFRFLDSAHKRIITFYMSSKDI
jgi:hypothetical protein